MPRNKGEEKTKVAVYLDGEAALVYSSLKNKSAGISAALLLISKDERYSFLFTKSTQNITNIKPLKTAKDVQRTYDIDEKKELIAGKTHIDEVWK